MVTPEDVVAAYAILMVVGIALAMVLVIGSISVVSQVRLWLRNRRYQYTKK